MNQDLFKQLPKVDVLMDLPDLKKAAEEFSHSEVKAAIGTYLDDLREKIKSGAIDALPEQTELLKNIRKQIEKEGEFTLKPVVNGTGVVLHTNMGRAPLGKEITERVMEVADGYCNLEYDIEEGKRGSRYVHVEKLLCQLTGAEAALVVNNNAAAVFLMLNTLAKGHKVAISRGELVEIGGAFRIPEIMTQSGAELYEVGTTNKTHPYDYERAADDGEADVFLKVHTSNFKMQGFTEEVALDELAGIAKRKNCLLLQDLGSAFLLPPETLGLHVGLTVQKCIADGADVVCFSGDKLLGSCQAGILVGKKKYIEAMKKNHLTRMLRVDKLIFAALEQTLHYYKDTYQAMEKVPVLHMLSENKESLCARAEDLKQQIEASCPEYQVTVIDCKDEPGGGSLPGVFLDGAAVSIAHPKMSADRLEKKLRLADKAVVGRISQDRFLLSMRTLRESDYADIIAALK